MKQNLNSETFEKDTFFDVIIVGGSYSGLSSAMALGRSLRKVLIIDSGKPCNIQAPHSHNFLTQDGKSPKKISQEAKSQVLKYETVKFQNGIAVNAEKTTLGFAVETDSGAIFKAKKLIFATGLKDIFPEIEGFAECWGISILHCPYCHGYEVRNLETGIMANGEFGFEFSKMISNWTKKLTIFTNGKAIFSKEQFDQLRDKNINVNEKEISKIIHTRGQISAIEFKDGSQANVDAVYAKIDFEQHCKIPEKLGCEINEQGLLKVDQFQKTTVSGIYACGDNATMRSVAFAVATGSMSGIVANKDLIFENF